VANPLPGSPMLLPLLAVLASAQASELVAVPQETPTPHQRGVTSSGDSLIAELGCARCHAGAGTERVILAPSLNEVAQQRSAAYLRRYLTDPLHVRPGTRMPDMLAGIEEPERSETIEDLVHYLAQRGGSFDLEPTGVSAELLEEGRQLFHEVGCVACHGPEEPLEALFEPLDLFSTEGRQPVAASEEGAPDLPLLDLAERTTAGALTEFLLDPVKTRRSGRMPSLGLSRPEAEAIAAYLLRDQVRATEAAPAPGLRYRYFEHSERGDVLDVQGLTPKREGVLLGEVDLPEHRENEFGLVFEGQLQLDVAGSYQFETTSDDGSELYIDGQLVVTNPGTHPMVTARGEVQLDAGAHDLRITFFEAAGGEGLEVRWAGPSHELRPLRGEDATHLALSLRTSAPPFTPEPERVWRGKAAFERLRCVSCHEVGRVERIGYGPTGDGPARGCLSDEPQLGVPHFGLSEPQRESLRLEVQAGRGPAPGEATPAEEVERVLAGARCTACHARGEHEGPAPSRREFFFSDGEIDLGEEGRIPPHLDGVGAKLTQGALHGVLNEGVRVRPYLLTRMPQFGPEALGQFIGAVQAADAPTEAAEPPGFDAELAAVGRRLAGTKGFGCIQCHTFAGYESLGIHAVDLALVDGRIRYPWFRELLRDPGSINMNTRMPGFWIDGESPLQDVLGGDKDAQIDAIWTYLSMGSSMPLPHGLVTPDSAYELLPETEPILAGVFMRDVSPRTVAVGLPEGIHYAFDVENSRLAYVWRGRFLNARGTWQGRAGALERPASEDVLALPAGPALALLASEDDPWPTTEGRAPALRPLGRRFDEERRPVWRYALGELEVEERLSPVFSDGELSLRRELFFRAPVPTEGLTFLLDDGTRQHITFQPSPSGEGYVAELSTVLSW
jgi:cytochrome c2